MDDQRKPDDVCRERDLLRALIAATPTFFVAIDANGKTRLMNRSMLEALGYEEEQVIGMDYLQTFVPEEDREALSGVFERIVKRRQRTLNENQVMTREGKKLLVEWHGTPMFDDHGHLEFFFGIGTDITERRHRDLLIEEREARYRALLGNTRDAVILADVDGEILDANEQAEVRLGYRKWELLDRTTRVLGLPAGPRKETETELRHKEGSEIPVLLTVIPFEAAERKCLLYLFRDV